MHYLVFYDYVEDYLERRKPLRTAHLELARQAVERGELLLGGVLEGTPEGAVLLFCAESASAVEAFIVKDPYVLHGAVKSWRIRQWHTVVGEGAAEPIR
jgi:uncharacterized protein YciI